MCMSSTAAGNTEYAEVRFHRYDRNKVNDVSAVISMDVTVTGTTTDFLKL